MAPEFKVWRKSRRSGANGGNCVEVAVAGGVVGLRDSKHLGGGVLVLTGPEFASLSDQLSRLAP